MITATVGLALALAPGGLGRLPVEAIPGACHDAVVWAFPPRQNDFPDSLRGREPEATVTRSRISLIAIAAAYYCLRKEGRYPRSASELLEFGRERRQQGEKKCLLSPEQLVDGWERPLLIDWTDSGPRIVSRGPDPALASDDIRLPALREGTALTVDPKTACLSP